MQVNCNVLIEIPCYGVFRLTVLIGIPCYGVFRLTVLIEIPCYGVFRLTVLIEIPYFKQIFSYELLVCNGIGQVISYIWTAGTGYSERVPQAAELFSRFCEWGNMKCEVLEDSDVKHINQPVFALDLCCNDTQWLREGGFTNPDVIGDVYHITKRILSAASVENKTSLGFFASELRKCFGSSRLGVFWPAKKIILAIELLQLKFQEVGVWAENTTRAFNTEKKHITNCLALPKVIK